MAVKIKDNKRYIVGEKWVMEKRDKLVPVVFAGFTVAAGFIGKAVDMVLNGQTEGQSLGMLIWLLLPLFVSIIIRVTNKGYYEPVGFKPDFAKNIKIYGIALFFYPLITLVSTRTAYHFKLLTVGELDKTIIGAVLVSAFIKNIVEEVTWRGNMIPFFEKTGWNDYLIYLSTGLIWSCWHIPYYLFYIGIDDSLKLKTILSGIVVMVLWTPLYVEVRRAAKSFIPAYLLHVTEELIASLIFAPIGAYELEKTYNLFMNPVNGIIPVVFIFVLGMKLRERRISRK